VSAEDFPWAIPSLHQGRGEGWIGGDVVSYVEYTIAALYEDAEEKKFVVLATGFWASLTLGPRGAEKV
jgi:hypothetical protein